MFSKKEKTFQDIAAGTFAGVVGTGIGHPLETIKVRLQTEPNRYRGMRDCAAQVIKEDGIRGLFRGMASPMVNLTILNSLAFGLYRQLKYLIVDINAKRDPYLDQYQSFIAGAGVGLASSCVSTPFEVIKVRLQRTGGSQYSGSFDAARSLINQYGPTVLYTGHIVNTFRETLFCAVYFGVYEWLKTTLSTSMESAGIHSTQIPILIAGGLAGVSGWLSSYPLDVVKNLKQTQDLTGTWLRRGDSCMVLSSKRWAHHGISGFYKGIRPSLVRSFIVSATRFSAYEFVLWMFEQQLLHLPLIISEQRKLQL